MRSLTKERVRELLRYDADSGTLTWLTSRGCVKVGAVVKRKNSCGYISLKIDGRNYLAHRVIWLYEHGQWPAADLDHINGQRADNRLSNLRPATRADNAQNRKVRRESVSGVLGVSQRSSGKWKASIFISGRTVYLGQYQTMEAAAAAYASAKRVHHTFHPDVPNRTAETPA